MERNVKKILVITFMLLAGFVQAVEYHVACVGDSITAGYPDSIQSYPMQLQALFEARDGAGKYTVGNYGVSARTLRNDGDFPYTADYWYTASLASNPDVVVIMLGANDAKVGVNWDVASKDGTNTSINIYNADYATLIDSYRALSPTPKIFVCTPIPVCTVGNGATFGISEAVISDEICPSVRSIVTAPSDVGMIELNEVFPHDQTAYYASGDKVHPSATGYALIAGRIYSTIKSVTATNEYHVAKNGNDSSDGSFSTPFLTIQQAADVAQPGDVINVHEGVYRERINPPRGGTSEVSRITYQAAPGEEVVIKGSEPVSGWTHVTNDTWKVKIPNADFGTFNPFRDALSGDWFTPLRQVHHSGSVFLDGHWLWEAASFDEVLSSAGAQPCWFTNDKDNVPDDGTSEGDEATITTIWAQFEGINPNAENVEISKRQAVFYPGETGRDYITVRGFTMEHAATPWAPPTYEQVGLIGTHWSKGWIIEDNTIRYSACTGVTLGKYYDPEDNWDYHGVIQRSLTNVWNKATVGSHVVHNNHISHCEMSGIVGSLGPIFSTISDNTIHDIHVRKLFTGFEMGAIKLHGAVDCLISGNTISNSVQGIWLDWMAQGTQITGNLLCNNERDLFFEVNHGPFLVDNNILCSPKSIYSVSRGGAYVHNLILGSCLVNHNETRAVPYLVPHGTDVVEYSQLCPSGDEQFYNNIFYGYGLATYDDATLPVFMEGNVFLNGAVPSTNEANPLVQMDSSAITLVPEADGAYLSFTYDSSWDQATRPLVTTELLGSALITGIPFEHPDGAPYRIDTDFYGADRNTNNPSAGPIVFAAGETNTFKVSHASGAAAPNMLAHWGFDEPSTGGSYTDSSGNGLDIAVTVAPAHITSGQAVGAGALDISAGQYLTLADNPADGVAALPLAGNSFSLSYWVKRKNATVNEYLIGMSDPTFTGSVHSNYSNKALHVGFRGSNATMDYYADGVDNLLTPEDTTLWHHYAVTYDADINQQRIVVDGNLLTSVYRTANDDFLGDVNANATAADIKNDFWIGRSFSAASFSGMLDDVRVYDGVLGDYEIYSLYAVGNPQGGTAPPSNSAPAVVTTFTGVDAEALDFSGEFVYAVNMGGTWNHADVTIQDATFVDSRDASNVTLVSTGNLLISPYYETQPAYGDGSSLNLLTHSLALAWGTSPASSLGISVEVTPGKQYELQMFFSENALKIANSRVFDISVEGELIVDEFTPIPTGAEWTTAPHTGVLVTYTFTAGDSVLNMDFTRGSSADGSPHVSAFTLKDVTPEVEELAAVTTFTGGDLGEGLDFSGDYLYAVNIAGNAQYPPVVQGITFINDALTDGVSVTLGGSDHLAFEYWGTKPAYGDTGNDNWLEAMMQATALSYNTDPSITVDLDVTPGQTYEMQLLFSENGNQTADSRNFDIVVDGLTILTNFTSIPAGAEWTTAPHTGVLVTYEFVASDSVAEVILTNGTSMVIQGVTLEDVTPPVELAAVTTFTGGDPGEGLDLSGEFVYQVNVAGSVAWPPLIQGNSFTNDTLVDGVSVTLGGSENGRSEWWMTAPVYGDAGNDNWLEGLMHATALTYGTDPSITVDLDVVSGQAYELQLLFSENANQTANARVFDIVVEDLTIVEGFTTIPAGAEWTTNPHTGVLVSYSFTAGDSVASIVLTNGTSAILQGVTLKAVGPIVSPFSQWAVGFLPTDIGSETDDYDGDLKDNFYEYLFGGDPTNQSVSGAVPVLENAGGGLQLLHVQRTDDASLVYWLEACTNLVSNTWTNFDYEVLGTHVTGGEFNFVTNSIPTSSRKSFIRLKAERR